MKVTSITFSLGRSIPLSPISGDPADAYASIRPSATVTVQLDGNDPQTEDGRKIIEEAFTAAAQMCFDEMHQFNVDLHKLYDKRRNKAEQ